MRQIGGDGPRQTFFLLVGRIPCLLGLNGCKLSQCGERDLAAAVFDALAPNMGEPYVLLARIAFQRFVGFRTATLTSYNGDGDIVDQNDLTIRAGASTTVELADINDGDVAAVSLADSDQSMVWNIRVSQKDVSDAKLAGVSIISATDLKEAREQVWSNQNMTIVR